MLVDEQSRLGRSWTALKRHWIVASLFSVVTLYGIFGDLRDAAMTLDRNFGSILKAPSDPIWRWILLLFAAAGLGLYLYRVERIATREREQAESIADRARLQTDLIAENQRLHAEHLAEREQQLRKQLQTEQMQCPTLLLRYFVANRELARFCEAVRHLEKKYEAMQADFTRYTGNEPLTFRTDVPQNYNVVDPTVYMGVIHGRFDAFKIPLPTQTAPMVQPYLAPLPVDPHPHFNVARSEYRAADNANFIAATKARLAEVENYIGVLRNYANKVSEKLEEWEQLITSEATRTQTGHPLVPSFHNILVD